jgi:dihydroorotate dehydrogenase electron transfer subunit
MPVQTSGIVVENKCIQPHYFLLNIHCPAIATKIQPGQFIMLKISEENSPLLRRPFSVYRSHPNRQVTKGNSRNFFILYKKVGKGTQKMTEFKEGQRLDMIGPLGNGFTLPPLPSSQNIFLIGGGVGIASLFPIAERLTSSAASSPAFQGGIKKRRSGSTLSKLQPSGGRVEGLTSSRVQVFIGAKTQNDLICVEDFRKLNLNSFVATEDGSLGFKGTVVDLFLYESMKFSRKGLNYVYSCGPFEMLKELAKVLRSDRFLCQVSLEARMACGFGACWGCVVKTRDTKTPYQRVCKEGPVFNLKNIIWE